MIVCFQHSLNSNLSCLESPSTLHSYWTLFNFIIVKSLTISMSFVWKYLKVLVRIIFVPSVTFHLNCAYPYLFVYSAEIAQKLFLSTFTFTLFKHSIFRVPQ